MKFDKTFYKKINTLSLYDQFIIKNILKKVEKTSDLQNKKNLIEIIKKKINQGAIKIINRQLNFPIISYSNNLPIMDKKEKICETIINNQIVIIAGETGSGKSTQIPKICLELGQGVQGLIGQTQPRRLAAKKIAEKIAYDINDLSNIYVNYKIRFYDKTSENTLIKIMTDGILLEELKNDKLLLKYDTLIIDEAHERSLNIDFIMGYLYKIIPQRPDLKIIITSATIDLEKFSHYFNNAPIIKVSGRVYPVETRYKKNFYKDKNKQFDEIIKAIKELDKEKIDNVIIFLSTEREIIDISKLIIKLNLKNTIVLPLFSRLSIKKQNLIFQKNYKRKIILSTNIAETSITINDVKNVIDVGYMRISRYNTRKKIQCLPIEPISQASAEQRKGRCGRTSPGICIRLYSKKDFLSRPKYTEPEILRTNLSSVILRMLFLNLEDINNFPFIEQPNKKNIKDGLILLKELNAIVYENNRYKLTNIGKKISQFPIDPRLGRILLESINLSCVQEIIIIISVLSIKDPREKILYKSKKEDHKDDLYKKFFDSRSDFLTLLNLWNFFIKKKNNLSSLEFSNLCEKYSINLTRLKEWINIYNQLKKITDNLNIKINKKKSSYKSIHFSLLSGFLTYIGKKIKKNRFLSTRNCNFSILPSSNLIKSFPKWIMVSEIIETKKIWGINAAQIETSWIEKLAHHLINYFYDKPIWLKKEGCVISQQEIKLFNLSISKNQINYNNINPIECRKIFIKEALVKNNWYHSHIFLFKNMMLLNQLKKIADKLRNRNIIVNNNDLFEFYNKKIPYEVNSSNNFNIWWDKKNKKNPDYLRLRRSFLLKKQNNKIDILNYPNYWFYKNIKLKLTYKFKPDDDKKDGVYIHIPLFILNQIDNNFFDWHIPGLRKDLIISLINSLPKKFRKFFSPISIYVNNFLKKFKHPTGRLLDVLIKELHQISGIITNINIWNKNQVPNYLKLMFYIVDENNKLILKSRDFENIKILLQDKIEQKISEINKNLEKNKFNTWYFNELPQIQEKKFGNYLIKSYPAIIEHKDKNNVLIKIFSTQEKQKKMMQNGLIRLLLINNVSLIKLLKKQILSSCPLHLYIYIKQMSILDDCVCYSIKKLINKFGDLVWNKKEYEKLRKYISIKIENYLLKLFKQVKVILIEYLKINNYISLNSYKINKLTILDIKKQISKLISKNFVTQYGYKKLSDILRYLYGIKIRLEKISINPNRDLFYTKKIEFVYNTWNIWFVKLSSEQKKLHEVKEIYWMIEELRISFFAQNLGTKYPISDNRILKKISEILV